MARGGRGGVGRGRRGPLTERAIAWCLWSAFREVAVRRALATRSRSHTLPTTRSQRCAGQGLPAVLVDRRGCNSTAHVDLRLAI